jgi:S-adenosylmethionine synthetase
MGVDATEKKEEGAGDQGIMFGYACNETSQLMPAPIYYAHRILQNIMQAVKNKEIPNFGDRKLTLSVAEPISVSDRLAEYQSSRAASKECTRKLTEEIHTSMKNLIVRSVL